MAKKNHKKESGAAAPPPKPVARETDKGAEKKERKRGLAATVELPSVVTPLLIWGGIFSVCYLLASLDQSLFGREIDPIMMWIAGVATILFAIVTPVYRNYRQLTKRFAKVIVFAVSAASLVIGVYAVWAGVSFGQPVARGDVHPGEKVAFHVPGSSYRLFLRGFFPPIKNEEPANEPTLPGKPAPKKSSKPTAFKVVGNYSVRISQADNDAVVQDFAGNFEDKQTYRRLTKRGRDYVHVLKTTALNDLSLPRAGDYRISVVTIDPKLEQKLEYAVYEKRQFPTPVFLVGLLASFLLGLIDYLARPLRMGSFFAVFIGLAYGFAGYLLLAANPISPFSALAVDMLVGFVMGGSLGYAVYTVSAKLYDGIARKYRLSLT